MSAVALAQVVQKLICVGTAGSLLEAPALLISDPLTACMSCLSFIFPSRGIDTAWITVSLQRLQRAKVFVQKPHGAVMVLWQLNEDQIMWYDERYAQQSDSASEVFMRLSLQWAEKCLKHSKQELPQVPVSSRQKYTEENLYVIIY